MDPKMLLTALWGTHYKRISPARKNSAKARLSDGSTDYLARFFSGVKSFKNNFALQICCEDNRVHLKL